MRPLFVDPRVDFAFWKIFGTEEHKPLLMALLNGLLELDEAHRVVEVELPAPGQRLAVRELMRSVVYAKCVDAQGARYVVEMQMLNVEGSEKRVVYNAERACTHQLERGEKYPGLNGVVGVTVCDFELWPRKEAPHVPMLSRWCTQEQSSGARGQGQLQLVFLELPKYDNSRPPRTAVEKWAYFFREADNLQQIPEVLAEPPYSAALEAARAAGFSEEEWEAYINAGMALQDKRGALSLARKEGKQETLQSSIRKILHKRGLELSAEEQARLERCTDLGTLERWFDQALSATSASEALS